MKYLFFLLIFCSFMVNAQVVVKKIKGKQALVDIRGGESLQEGQILNVNTGAEDVVQTKSLTKREHVLSWKIDSGSVKNERKSASSIASSEASFSQFMLSYGYNFKAFQLGGELQYASDSSGSANNSSTQLGIFGKYNFIQDIPGESVVPSVGLSLGSYGMLSSSSSSDTTYRGSYYRLFGGLSWYPFNEILAIETTLYSATFNYSATVGNSSVSVVTTQTGLSAGFSLVF